MLKQQVIRVMLASTTLVLLFASNAAAQNNRSFVATTGNDANNCSASAFCRTFGRALAVTNAGGEIIVVDSGGYGPATITQPVTISANGIVASITQATAGQNALTINSVGNVTISGLSLHGQGAGNDGILVESVGFLRLYNMTIEDFKNDGVQFPAVGFLAIYDSKISSNGANGLATGSGTYVHNTSFDGNVNAGVFASGGGQDITDAHATANGVGFQSSGGFMVLLGAHIFGNGTGLKVSGGGILFMYSLVTGNGTACSVSSGVLNGTSPATSFVAPPCTLSGSQPLQ